MCCNCQLGILATNPFYFPSPMGGFLLFFSPPQYLVVFRQKGTLFAHFVNLFFHRLLTKNIRCHYPAFGVYRAINCSLKLCFKLQQLTVESGQWTVKVSLRDVFKIISGGNTTIFNFQFSIINCAFGASNYNLSYCCELIYIT